MRHFWAGFGVASLAWGGLVGYLVAVDGMAPRTEAPPDDPVPCAEALVPTVEEAPSPAPRGRRRRSAERLADAPSSAVPTGTATRGDLGQEAPRVLDLGAQGGERQLSSAQIERVFDGAMTRIRRCLVLAPGDAPVLGRLTFALRIGPDGRVRGAQLTGPAALSTGEAGDCLLSTARSLLFPSFDGPEMVVRFPLDLR